MLDRQHLMSASITSLLRAFVFSVTIAENPASQRYVEGDWTSMVSARSERRGQLFLTFAQNVESSSVKLIFS